LLLVEAKAHQRQRDGWSHRGFRARFKGFALSSRHFRGSVAHGVQVNSVALGNGKVFMRRAPDIFGVHALRDPPVCSTRRAESSWDTSGRCSSFAGIRVLAWPCLPMSALKLRWSNDAVQDPKTTRLAACVSSLYLQSGSARSPSRNEIMTSSITNTSRLGNIRLSRPLPRNRIDFLSFPIFPIVASPVHR
jgi:hypothetical protein